ncbi:hypothetical protein GpSGHVEth127 [Glossina pallidipes salivary gland hypertrophy virus]|uniref:Uncharacterized protein n=1 Tax=Glossina hytrovirus (isolate Glossina pallidipes/Ethiopia/Seibersdorf/-) TaxID=379529 RepID=A0A110AML5_GHVS|nr:hypothetical protein GpSGHVEth127 [Glossina pallidipes salivary gland hypertrophy virus]
MAESLVFALDHLVQNILKYCSYGSLYSLMNTSNFLRYQVEYYMNRMVRPSLSGENHNFLDNMAYLKFHNKRENSMTLNYDEHDAAYILSDKLLSSNNDSVKSIIMCNNRIVRVKSDWGKIFPEIEKLVFVGRGNLILTELTSFNNLKSLEINCNRIHYLFQPKLKKIFNQLEIFQISLTTTNVKKQLNLIKCIENLKKIKEINIIKCYNWKISLFNYFVHALNKNVKHPFTFTVDNERCADLIVQIFTCVHITYTSPNKFFIYIEHNSRVPIKYLKIRASVCDENFYKFINRNYCYFQDTVKDLEIAKVHMYPRILNFRFPNLCTLTFEYSRLINIDPDLFDIFKQFKRMAVIHCDVNYSFINSCKLNSTIAAQIYILNSYFYPEFTLFNFNQVSHITINNTQFRPQVTE